MNQSVKNTIIGAIVGSILTFTLPKLYNYLFTDSVAKESADPTIKIADNDKVNTTAKEFVTQTPIELTAWYSKIANDVQANMLAEKLYYGKFIKFSGTIDRMEHYPGDKIKIRTGNVSAFFDINSPVATLTTNDKINFAGRIVSITGNTVQVHDCELIQ